MSYRLLILDASSSTSQEAAAKGSRRCYYPQTDWPFRTCLWHLFRPFDRSSSTTQIHAVLLTRCNRPFMVTRHVHQYRSVSRASRSGLGRRVWAEEHLLCYSVARSNSKDMDNGTHVASARHGGSFERCRMRQVSPELAVYRYWLERPDV